MSSTAKLPAPGRGPSDELEQPGFGDGIPPLVDGSRRRAGGGGIYWLRFSKHSAGRKAANRAVRGAITSKVSTDQKTAAPAAIRTGPSRLDHHCVSWGTSSSERIGLTLKCRHHGNLPRLGARREWRGFFFCEAPRAPSRVQYCLPETIFPWPRNNPETELGLPFG
jgi:hypothetical protein